MTTADYRELETGVVGELEEFQKRNGFTGVTGQYGYCLAYFESKNNTKLANHQTTCIKNPAVTCELKGVSETQYTSLKWCSLVLLSST